MKKENNKNKSAGMFFRLISLLALLILVIVTLVSPFSETYRNAGIIYFFVFAVLIVVGIIYFFAGLSIDILSRMKKIKVWLKVLIYIFYIAALLFVTIIISIIIYLISSSYPFFLPLNYMMKNHLLFILTIALGEAL